MMDLWTNTVVDLQLVQSNEVGGSYHMEKEGLKRSLALLESRNVTFESIVTDRHPQIQKFLREANITHYYDVWQLEKGLSKKLVKISQNKKCEKLHPSRISRHKGKWLKEGTPAFHKLEKVLTNKRVLKAVEKLSPHFQTSSLESFHSVILQFAPKNVVFPFIGMLCRLYLAVLHFNENAGRPQATSSDGEPLFRVSFPKSKKGECTAKPVKAEPTFLYVDKLMDLIFEEVFQDPALYTKEMQQIPVPQDLCAGFDRPDKLEVITGYVSRFNGGLV